MKIIRALAIAIALVLLLLLGVAFFLPSSFSAQRSALITAPAAQVYAKFASPRTWARWSAWSTAADPSLVYTYAGPDSGVGAIMQWTSKKMGSGQLRIVEAEPGQRVSYELGMTGSDMAVHGQVTFEPAGEGTKVTWHDTGSLGKNVLARYLGPVLDKSLAAAYEKSFANLQREAKGE
jgi:uncharacterized protein YndB with AHSA1/START domain